MFIDTHCHLDWDSYDGELDLILERARTAGVRGFVTIGTELDRNAKAKQIASAFPDVYRCIGYHPDVVIEEGFDQVRMNEWLKRLEDELGDKKVVGIGECGLDYYSLREMNNEELKMKKELQKELFERQILIAVREGLPLSLHMRDVEGSEEAYWDALEILEEYFGEGAGEKELAFSLSELQYQYEMETGSGIKSKDVTEKKVNGVMHCVSGPVEYVRRMVEMGFMAGACGNITFKNAQPLRDLLKEVPMSMMVLETDAPFLAPVPYRGKRNESAYMIETAKCVAEIKGTTLEEVERITTENAKKLFKI